MKTKLFVLLALLSANIIAPACLQARGGSAYFPGAIVAASSKKAAAEPDDIRLDPTAATISTAALKAILDSGVGVTLVDARDPKYDDRKRIGNAFALCIKNSDKEVESLIPQKKGLIVVYCGDLKCPSSQYMAQRLSDMGYVNVIEYPYGIRGWLEAKLPVTRDQKRKRR